MPTSTFILLPSLSLHQQKWHVTPIMTDIPIHLSCGFHFLSYCPIVVLSWQALACSRGIAKWTNTHTHHMPIFFFLFSLSLSPTSPHTCFPYMKWQIPGHALACPCTLQVTSPILNAGSMARIIAREGTCHMPTSTSFLFLSSHLLPQKNVTYGHRPTLVP